MSTLAIVCQPRVDATIAQQHAATEANVNAISGARRMTSLSVPPREQVIPLEGRSERLQKGDDVLAVYVDTTSFYHATIAIPPRGRGAQIVSERTVQQPFEKVFLSVHGRLLTRRTVAVVSKLFYHSRCEAHTSLPFCRSCSDWKECIGLLRNAFPEFVVGRSLR